jgi:hypothetical protein
VESGHAVCYLGNAKKQTLRDGTFYAEDPFITTLSMMVEENGDFNAAATSDTQRMYGLQAVSDCHCLELGIKDVFEAFEGNRDVLRLLTRCNLSRAKESAQPRQRQREPARQMCALRGCGQTRIRGQPRATVRTPHPPTQTLPPTPFCVVFPPRSTANLFQVLRCLGVGRERGRESETEGKGRYVWLYRPYIIIIYKII